MTSNRLSVQNSTYLVRHSPTTLKIWPASCWKLPQVCILYEWVLHENHSGITFTPLFLQLLINLSSLWTGMFSLFHELKPLWPKLHPMPPLGPPYGMHFLPLYAFTSGSLSASFFSSQNLFYSQNSHTGSTTEWPLQWAALYKLINTKQCWTARVLWQ